MCDFRIIRHDDYHGDAILFSVVDEDGDEYRRCVSEAEAIEWVAYLEARAENEERDAYLEARAENEERVRPKGGRLFCQAGTTPEPTRDPEGISRRRFARAAPFSF